MAISDSVPGMTLKVLKFPTRTVSGPARRAATPTCQLITRPSDSAKSKRVPSDDQRSVLTCCRCACHDRRLAFANRPLKSSSQVRAPWFLLLARNDTRAWRCIIAGEHGNLRPRTKTGPKSRARENFPGHLGLRGYRDGVRTIWKSRARILLTDSKVARDNGGGFIWPFNLVHLPHEAAAVAGEAPALFQ